MERHEFDAAYARICKVCGMKTQTELSAYLGIRQSSMRVHAAAGSLGRAGAGAAHPGGADERDGMYRRRNPGSR